MSEDTQQFLIAALTVIALTALVGKCANTMREQDNAALMIGKVAPSGGLK